MVQLDPLTTAFYDVMYQYQLPFTPEGVAANLNTWRESKTPLVELLRRHPNWNERELAVVFDFSEDRKIDRNAVDESCFEMTQLAQMAGLQDGELQDFTAALEAATADHATVPDAGRLETIRQRGGIKCAEGQKASRIVNRLCLHFGLDRYETDKVTLGPDGAPVTRRVKPYHAAFARLADSLNPVRIPKTGVLSVHPCDFLEMSSKKSTWNSCHRLNGGGYRGGCQSYMGDGVSMIFFNSIRENFYQAPRLTRQIFCYRDGVLLQSRLYPDNNSDTRKLYRGLVQRTIAQCEGAPDLWKTYTGADDVRPFLQTAERSLHYPDYIHGYGVVSLLKASSGNKPLMIGSRTLCTCCGQPVAHHADVKCGVCSESVVCKECGRTVSKWTAHYLDGAYFCGECISPCDCCGELKRGGELRAAVKRGGRIVRLCERCYSTETAGCASCGSREICRIIDGGRFCSRADYAAAA